MVRQIATSGTGAPRRVTGQDLVDFKAVLIGGLGGLYSAVSTDLEYGYPACLRVRDRMRGLILSVQKRTFGYVPLGERPWRNELLHEWLEAGKNIWDADAFKVTIYYRRDLPGKVRERQKEVVLRCAEKCRQLGALFILEIMSQPLTDREKSDPRVYAKNLPDIVAACVDTFADRTYGADVLKVDFPADLRFCDGAGIQSNSSGEPLYDRRQAEDFCSAISRRSPVPWIIMSGGVDLPAFEEKVRIACSCGCSGFIGGRSLWADASSLFPDENACREWLQTEAPAIHRRVKEASLPRP
jgi:tagatose 1,6-diphosphate aldolase